MNNKHNEELYKNLILIWVTCEQYQSSEHFVLYLIHNHDICNLFQTYIEISNFYNTGTYHSYQAGADLWAVQSLQNLDIINYLFACIYY